MNRFSRLAVIAALALPLPALAQNVVDEDGARAALDRAVAKVTQAQAAADETKTRVAGAMDKMKTAVAPVPTLKDGPLPTVEQLQDLQEALDKASADAMRSPDAIYHASDLFSSIVYELAEAEALLTPSPPKSAQAPETGVTPAPASQPSEIPPDLTLSREIAANGIAATEARLAAVVEPPPEDRFALAGLRFLAAVEGVLQARYRVGLSAEIDGLPLLRLPLPPNPTPEPFQPAFIRDTLTEFLPRMEQARAPLEGLDDDFGLDIAFNDLWFDVNANGKRDSGEDLAAISGSMLGIGGANLPTVRFDTADAAWLAAYTHMLSGFAQVVLAYDPTDALEKTMETRAALAKFPREEDGFADLVGDFWIDTAATVLNALRSEPNAEHAKAAQQSFLSMIAENRVFWQRVAAETDNTREWIPGQHQQSATGVELPPETGTTWLAVLADAEAALKGEALIPYWRTNSGVNLGRMFTDPRPIDLIDWVSGAGAVPYLETGKFVSSESLDSFNGLFLGDGLMMAAWLN